MRAIAVDPARRSVDLIDHPPPELGSPTSVRLRILDVGVCGTDREIAALDYGLPPPGADYLVLGHESLAEVVDVGDAVRRVEPGQLVVPTVRRPCPHPWCIPCREGRQDFCSTGDFSERGIVKMHGYMTELVVEDERYLNPVPRGLRDVAVLVEPLTIAEKAMIQVRLLQQRLPWACPLGSGGKHACHRAVVLGAGPVGLLGAMKLVAEGFETWVYSRTPTPNDRAPVVEAIGARYLPAESVPPGEIGKQIGDVDLFYEAMGASQASFEAMAALGPNGIFVFTGVPGRRGPVEIDTDRLMRDLVLRNQVVLGTVNAGLDAFAAAVADVAAFRDRWPEALQGMITARRPMEDYRELLFGRPAGIKNVISVGA